MKRKFVFSFGENYHIYDRGIEKRVIFQDSSDYKRFVFLLNLANSNKPLITRNSKQLLESGMLIKNDQEIITNIGAWCLMPNHFHLLLNEKIDGGISKFMSKVLTGYTMYFNQKYNRKGRLFESTFQAKHANTDEYLKYLLAYIHLNPIKIIDSEWKEAGIKDLPKAKNYLKNYNYSSYLDYLGHNRIEEKILNKEAFPEYFDTSLDFDNNLLEWLKYNDRQGLPLAKKDCQG